MDTQLRKLFYGFGDIYDDPGARSFIRAYPDAAGIKGSLLLVNRMNPSIDLCDWIANEGVDLGRCKRLFRHGVPVFVSAPAGVTVSCGKRRKSVIGSAAVLETDNAIAFEACPPGFRRLGEEDARLFDGIENDYAENDIATQTKGNLAEPEIACFGMFAEGALAAFADVAKLRGSMFADSYSLANIFTVRRFRRQGFATALLRGILQAYPDKHFYYTAQPATNIASVRSAQACGFAPVGETTVYQFTEDRG